MEAQEVTLLPVTAQQAPSWGMIWQAVPDDDLLAEVRRLARELARGATFGPGLTKHAIQAAATNTLAQQLEHPVIISRLRRLGARYSCFVEQSEPPIEPHVIQLESAWQPQSGPR